ncbi:ribonucleotide reductase stimulatory protein [Enterococcus plantarum]|uniref:class Ib ribonucleoside-diphosphate reductase assembly flavoprotein NrdI n=1 Tax=Enterococcus TaxID=1350 RepID=UPI00084D8097|nr:class Ib ribonucleoside-diphosphate reductase assembly flavoprotein NrdI [Enterococcus plantarum]MBO0424025.1 class Ib ribonucleoside-diphosphate reductase assembly flavoprotein NrdI [Enterococcus plantarum]MBO0467072.1 class Ib ribonucleoside-diphosphate reductase assembly flavoprotein NrdI [Enterococcus plantarum]OEG18271.1 ribonucleotide reductase stimulatory protein [Enterococcus plantarum]
MKIVYFSVTGQTRRFIKKLDLAAYEIEPANPFFEINEPFVLVVPTYDQEITEVVNDFLDYKSNRENLQGVAGGGNLNFAELFVYTAKDIARDYNVPMLFAFEFSGTNEDVESFKKVVNELESKRN